MCLGTAMTYLVVAFLLDCPTTTSQRQSEPVTGPHFNLTVNQSSKSITVYVEPGNIVYTRWCYTKESGFCDDGPNAVTIDPFLSRSAVLNVPYLLPCLCVQVYYTTDDAKRVRSCPLSNSTISDVTDVWYSNKVVLYNNSLIIYSVCPAAVIQMSAALCWKQHEHLCTVVFNLSLVETVIKHKREYNTSVVDKHPQMCIQLSLQGKHNVSCPFKADMSSWRVHTGLGRQGVYVYITSFRPAKFSVQLCKLNQRMCTPVGRIYSQNIEQKTATLEVPLLLIEERPCVQVWQSALQGRRIFCPDYTRSRCGIYAVAALAFVVVVIVLGICIHHLAKKSTAGWLCIERPVLLVCSSEESAHVSTVYTLASILQGDLGATVHLALWAQSTQKQNGTGVADLGPLPWLHGQWETVMKAQGHVLIIWSPDAKKACKWWNEKDKSEKRKDFYTKRDWSLQKILLDDSKKLKGWRHGKCKLKKSKKRSSYVSVNKDTRSETEPCTVIAPVFQAALTCLMGALHENKGQRVAFVCLQGHGNIKEIPKAFRGVSRYCLPLEFSGLIQELGVITIFTKNSKSKLHCWSRLMSKVLLFWLAKRLACRLQALLPQ